MTREKGLVAQREGDSRFRVPTQHSRGSFDSARSTRLLDHRFRECLYRLRGRPCRANSQATTHVEDRVTVLHPVSTRHVHRVHIEYLIRRTDIACFEQTSIGVRMMAYLSIALNGYRLLSQTRYCKQLIFERSGYLYSLSKIGITCRYKLLRVTVRYNR